MTKWWKLRKEPLKAIRESPQKMVQTTENGSERRQKEERQVREFQRYRNIKDIFESYSILEHSNHVWLLQSNTIIKRSHVKWSPTIGKVWNAIQRLMMNWTTFPLTFLSLLLRNWSITSIGYHWIKSGPMKHGKKKKYTRKVTSVLRYGRTRSWRL